MVSDHLLLMNFEPYVIIFMNVCVMTVALVPLLKFLGLMFSVYMQVCL
jgi:hypothetical protein